MIASFFYRCLAIKSNERNVSIIFYVQLFYIQYSSSFLVVVVEEEKNNNI